LKSAAFQQNIPFDIAADAAVETLLKYRTVQFSSQTHYTSDENKVIRIAKCDVFSGVCESIR